MDSNIDAQTIMEEVQRLVQDRRRQLSAGQLEAHTSLAPAADQGREALAASANQADLLNPNLVPITGIAGLFARILRPFRRKFLFPFLSRQTTFNQAMLESIEPIASRLQSLPQEMKAEMEEMKAEMERLREHGDRSVTDLIARQEEHEAEMERLREHGDRSVTDLIARQEEHEADIGRLREHGDRSVTDLIARQEKIELTWLRTPTTEQTEQAALRARLDELRMDFLKLSSRWEGLREDLRDSVDKELSGIRLQVADLGRQWRRLFWEEGKRTLPPALSESAKEYREEFDYFGFEERLRGSETSIKDGQESYLQYFAEPFPNCGPASEQGDNLPILDIGCGRGEFLEILREASLLGHGVDASLDNVLRCQEKGLEVVHADALEYLASLPDESQRGIFACQFIEHLPVDYLVAFIRACFQKIHPGGKVIFETINPDCLMALRNFYADLSHQKVIPSTTARFLVESSGFQNVAILYRSPYPIEHTIPLCAGDTALAKQINQAFKQLNQILFGPQDYAVIGTRLV